MLIGTNLDGYFKLRCPVSLSMDRESRVQYHSAADGGMSATLFGGLAGGRVWTAVVGTRTPADSDLLESFATDALWYRRGSGVGFVPPGGERINLFSREEASLARTAAYTPIPVTTEDGVVMGYYAGSTDQKDVISNTPLPIGVGSVTFSAYVRGSSMVTLWLDGASGPSLYWATRTLKGTGASFTRSSMTVPVPDAARSITVSATGEFTRPALTAGDVLYPWGRGQRAESVVVEQDSTEQLWTGSRDPRQTYLTKQQYKITELRAGDPA